MAKKVKAVFGFFVSRGSLYQPKAAFCEERTF